jgi:transposase-like protein
LTALARLNLRGHLDDNDRNYIGKLFQTVTMRIDRFHSIWIGSSASGVRWLNRFKYHYNRQRPNQALDGRTPVEEMLN